MEPLRRISSVFGALALVAGGCAEGVVDESSDSAAKSEAPKSAASGSSNDGIGSFSDATDVDARCPSIAVDREALLARTRELSSRHGVEMLVAFDGCPTEKFVHCSAVTAREYVSIVTFLDQVESDLEIYPADFFRTIHLDYVMFGSALETNDAEPKNLGGAAVPHGDHRSVLYLSTRQARFCNAALNRRTLHHELAHALDMGMTSVSETGWWPLLNPAGFTYGDVDPNAADLLEIDHPGAGLITRYARASVAEDHAEVYTALFMTKDTERLRGWLREDRWLASKFRSVIRPLEATWPSFAQAMPSYDAIP